MFRWLICLLFSCILFCQDDGRPPSFVNIDPIEDFYSLNAIELEIIVTDRNEIEEVILFYKFNDEINFRALVMDVSYQPVIFQVEIPMDEIETGFIQYYFWSKDEFQNGATWPTGGEDMPIVYPIYPTRQDNMNLKTDILIQDNTLEAPEKLEDNLPYYLEIGMLSPFVEVKEEEGVPIVVLSVYDPEEIVNLESVRLLFDGEKVSSFNDVEMITYVPQEPIKSGYHILRYESKNILEENLFKEFAFLVIEKPAYEFEEDSNSWKEKIKFKGNLGWDSNYDEAKNRPSETQKVNSSIKFQLGEYKFNLYGLINTHINNQDRNALEYRQPLNRIKFKVNSPYIDFYYGDNSLDFSDFTLKGTRVRGLSTKLKWGNWETLFVSGETKHKFDYNLSQIDVWEGFVNYDIGERVYYNGDIWESITSNLNIIPSLDNEDVWMKLIDSKYSQVSNDECVITNPYFYGLITPDTQIEYNIDSTLSIDPTEIDTFAIWNGNECEQVILYSNINMLTGEDGLENGNIFKSVESCLNKCKIPIIYAKGSNRRELEGMRTSKDFFDHAKLGISLIRSRDMLDDELSPYSIFKESYNYEGNMVLSTDFLLHFNNDKTQLSGEYGISLTIDQTKTDTMLLRRMSDIPDSLNIYNQINWIGKDYCNTYSDNQCFDINNNDTLEAGTFHITEGIITSDSILWSIYSENADNLDKYANFLGFNITDDIAAYDEGRGFSGLNSTEFSNLVNGGLDSMYLLFKKPTFKINFKTPITLSFTEIMFQTELNQASLNFRSNGSSSIQNNLRNWKNKIGFKLWKNQISISLAYNKQIKSPWDPIDINPIKRTLTSTNSGTIGLNIPQMPTLNYSFRFQDRKDIKMSLVEKIEDGESSNSILESESGHKVISTHTFTPSYKFKFKSININYNGNISIVKDFDMLSDSSQCFEILNNNSSSAWGGVLDTNKCGDNPNKFYFKGSNNYPYNNFGAKTSTLTNALALSFSIPLSINLGWGFSKNTPNDARKSATLINVFSSKIGYKLFDKKLNISIGANYVLGYKASNGFWDSDEELIIDRNGIWNPGEELLEDDGNGIWNEGENWIDLEVNGKYDEGENYTDIKNQIWDEGELWEDGNGVWDEGELWIDEGSDGVFTPGDTFIDKVELDNAKMTLKGSIQYKIPEQNITIGFNINYTESTNNLLLNALKEKPLVKAKLSVKFGF